MNKLGMGRLLSLGDVLGARVVVVVVCDGQVDLICCSGDMLQADDFSPKRIYGAQADHLTALCFPFGNGMFDCVKLILNKAPVLDELLKILACVNCVSIVTIMANLFWKSILNFLPEASQC